MTRKVSVITGLVFLLTGAGIIRTQWYFRGRENGFTDALATTATIIDHRMEDSGGKNSDDTPARTHYMLTYRYAVSGRTYVAEDVVGQALWNSAGTGSTHTVYYRRSHPEDGVLVKPAKSYLLLLIGVPFALMGGALIVSAFGDPA